MSFRVFVDCEKKFVIGDDGVISAGDTSGYENLLQNPNDIPNLAYVNGLSGIGGSGISGFSGFGYSGFSGASGLSGIGAPSYVLVHQDSHSFSIGDVIRYNGSSYVKAQADSPINAEVIGIVSDTLGIDDFEYITQGFIEGLSSLVAGDVYFLSESVAGTMSLFSPTGIGEVSKPLLLATSATEGQFFNFRGVEIVDDPGISGFSGYSGGGSAATASIIEMQVFS